MKHQPHIRTPSVYRALVRSFAEDHGVSLTEYCLLAGLITLVCIVAVGLVGTSVSGLYNQIDAVTP